MIDDDKTPQQKWRESNPKAYWAHRATHSALNSGLIEKGPCETCDDPDAEAHHSDYDRPLLIQWLCRACHKALHAKERREAI